MKRISHSSLGKITGVDVEEGGFLSLLEHLLLFIATYQNLKETGEIPLPKKYKVRDIVIEESELLLSEILEIRKLMSKDPIEEGKHYTVDEHGNIVLLGKGKVSGIDKIEHSGKQKRFRRTTGT
jgi:hypothetical protein